jgi:signal transduction histidine kinase
VTRRSGLPFEEVTTVTTDRDQGVRWRPSWSDVALAAVVAIVEIGVTLVAQSHQDPYRDFDAVAFLLLASGPIALAWRRRYPVHVYGVVFGTTLAYWAAGYPRGPLFLALVSAFGTLLLAGHRRLAWAALGVGYVAFIWLGALLGTTDEPSVAQQLGIAAWLLVLGTTTEILRLRRERAAEAARVREEEQRLRAGQERLRIVRELHDVVAHNLSLINVQAGTALHIIDERPQYAESALSSIKQASKDALYELRSLVDVLRDGVEAAPRMPTPTLADLEALVERTNAAGVPVELHIDGIGRPLPASIETTAYRVAQEALTNVARHAGPARAVVQLCYRPDSVVVEIDDDGRGPAPGAVGGKGLTGMRERVHALGGRLDASPRPDHGFRVRAWIPTGDHA